MQGDLTIVREIDCHNCLEVLYLGLGIKDKRFDILGGFISRNHGNQEKARLDVHLLKITLF